jgi:hypothetical protein
VIALARIPVARLSRTPRAWLGAAVWFLLALWLAFGARRSGAAHGADRVLLDGYAGYALPLLAYTIVGAALGGGSLAAAIAPVVTFGASRRRAALATLGAAVVGCAVAAGVLAAVVAAVAHGDGDPPRLRDALVSGYAGLVGGAAYASWYAFGASLGRRGGGRVALLVLDFLAAGSDGVFALATPRAHVANLLGGAAVMGWPERGSAAALVGMTALFGALATYRAGRPDR